MSRVRSGGRRVVVLGAAGAVGRWYRRRLLRDSDTVTTADRAGEVDHREDVCAPGPALRAAVAEADAVVLALPEDTAAACLSWLSGTARADAFLVTTCSVQRPLFEQAEAEAVPQRLLGVNPMFSPSLASEGRPVVLVAPDSYGEPDSEPDGESSGGAEAELKRLRERLEEGAMAVTQLAPGAHDSAMSYLQALPHAAVLGFVGALAGSPLDLDTLMRIAPPPARTLVALASRILAAPPEIYWDIQRANAEAGARRGELADALARLDATVAEGREDDFRAALAEASGRLGDYAHTGAEECQAVFARLQDLSERPGKPGESREQ